MRTVILFATLVTLAVAFVLAPPRGALAGTAQEGAQKRDTTPAEELPLVIPEEEKSRNNPIEPTKKSVETGRKLFSSQCTMCHGAKGDGKGDLAEQLNLSVPDFTDSAVQKKRTQGELYYILTHGHGRMPGQGERLRPEQKWHLINFIGTLARADKGATQEGEKE